MNSIILEVVLFAAVAAFLLYRLHSVLGTRTGNEDPPDLLRQGGFAGRKPRGRPGAKQPYVHPDNDNPAEQDVAADDDLALRGLPASDGRRQAVAEIRRVEPRFRLDEFTEKASQAYEWIYLGFEQGDHSRLRPLLSDEVYEDFVKIIDKRAEDNLVVDVRMVGVLDTAVEKVSYDAERNCAEIEVRFTSEVVRAVRNQQGEVIEGDPKSILRRVDHWTFERELGSRDPNWILIEA